MELKEHSLWLSKRDNVHSYDLSFVPSVLTFVFLSKRRGKTRHFYARCPHSTHTSSLGHTSPQSLSCLP